MMISSDVQGKYDDKFRCLGKYDDKFRCLGKV